MQRALISLFTLSVVLITTATGLAAPKAELWDYWQKHDEHATRTVDHTPWEGFLQKHVNTAPDGINRLNYHRVTDGDKKQLAAYLQTLAQTPVRSLARREQLPFWINLYNALTVQVILDHFPVMSITKINISPGFFKFGPWDKKLVTIEGKEVSLNDIEHRILRPIWQDNRLHYAINCASLGCPNLEPAAYTAANTEALLEAGARAYVNHPRGVAIEGDNLIVSSIYHWFADDFGGTDEKVIAHLQRYAAPELAEKLAGFRKIANHQYDWRLNGAF